MAPFTLPALPYAEDALAPGMSRETLEYHHGKHHKAYVEKLNELIPGTKFEPMPLEEIIKNSDGPIFNNAAQVWNHTFFFEALSPQPQPKPSGELTKAIDRDFGSLDVVKEQMTRAAIGLFGSGWAWLVKDVSGRLAVVARSNAANPMTEGMIPLLNMDLWEHAYYIDYRNRRADFIAALWEIVEWKQVESRYF